MTPNLNWRELESLIRLLRPELLGTFVDRVAIPERKRFSQGYLKGEWGIRLGSRSRERILIFSVRPRNCYITLREGKEVKNAGQATRSAFDLEAHKYLRGAKLIDVEALPRERIAVFWFSYEGSEESRIGLVIALIPATPEALLVQASPDQDEWQILARTRVNRNGEETVFTPPKGSNAPEDPPVREEYFKDARSFSSVVEAALDAEAFESRLRAAEKILRDSVKQARERARQSEVGAREAQAEPDWEYFGILLKNSMAEPPPIESGDAGAKGKKATPIRRIFDFEKQEYIAVPCDPKLDVRAQVTKFFSLARRKGRRLSEAQSRLEGFQETIRRLEKQMVALPVAGDWQALEILERAVGIISTPATPEGAAGGGKKVRRVAWLGRTFTSKDGSTILVGKSKDENLELTFKVARGNDIWMHVRGKPGAHTVIPIQTGKSASLETLLDAAALTVFYSGGESWGKTEVDYTFKKYVKRIRDSSEASYTNNKTLLVAPDAQRMKRLLGGE